MIRILVTGAKGQLGQSFQQLSTAYPQWHFRFLDRATLDICDPKAVQHVFSEGNYNYCINCAAYTAVDKAESEPTAAFSINRDATALLAAACGNSIAFSSIFLPTTSMPPRPMFPFGKMEPFCRQAYMATPKGPAKSTPCGIAPIP
jgi:dTDP-4-dehydrorhamnose reductase